MCGDGPAWNLQRDSLAGESKARGTRDSGSAPGFEASSNRRGCDRGTSERTLADGLGRPWTALDGPGRPWTALDGPELPITI